MNTKNQDLSPIDWRIFSPAPIVGVDEVGRGCLAGPVFACAASLKSEAEFAEITDSKLIRESKREELSLLIEQNFWLGIGTASVEEIDRINIFQASLLAMKRAVIELSQNMKIQPGHILVDGKFPIPNLEGIRQTPIIKGDLRVLLISAASIFAKVKRDRMMRDMSIEFPEYGFDSHKGYASEAHRTAIAKKGPCPHHRKSFSGVKEFL